MIKEREANSWKSVSYAKSISGTQTYTKFPIVLRTTEQSISTWNVKGNMQQSGTPTPSNPVDVNGVGVRTENLFDENYTGIMQDIITYLPLNVGDGDYTLSSTTTREGQAAVLFLLAGNVSTGATTVNNGVWNEQSRTVTAVDGYVTIGYRKYPTANPENFDTMLNIGSTAKPYEPHGCKLPIVSGNTTTNIYLSEPLRKIGDYADTIAADGTVTRRIKKYTFTGEETTFSCVATTDGQNYCVAYRFIDFGMTDIKDFNVYMMDIQYPVFLSDRFTQKSDTKKSNYNDISDGEMGANSTSGQNRYIIFCVAGLTTAADYRAWFAQQYANGTPVEVYYILETPTTETTTTSAIPTTSGLNTIDVNTTLKPSEMSLTYDGYKLCKRQRYTLLLSNNPLCGINTYKDILNLATGTCTRQIKKLVLTGQENWVDGNFPLTNTYLYYLTLSDMINVGNVAALDIVCSHFQVGNYYAGQDAPGIQHTLIELYLRTTETTLASFKQWLADQYTNGTPVTLYYILATPTTETITVPTGLSGTEEGYLTQSSTPTPTNPVYPTANDVPVWE